ncbi:MAG: prepilin-type N-terminal cleavage/methylation domain-containing protein [Candidatus Beckwithbacteria bacterium]|nr:prepilin-type N-terminal cleavage/methylation domain-containing protein [Candidatus Beckwithbacteria bacterium]
MKKTGFTLVELLVSITILGILASIGLGVFTSAQIKSRDARRKSNLDQISKALEMYFNDYKEYPDSDTGNISGFTWGTSSFQDTKGTVYMVKLPKDPVSGYTYYYAAIPTAGINTKFQLYAHLENTQDPSIITPSGSPNCGTGKPCNYGVSSSNTTP